jgi:hypothetical protein
MSPIFDNNEHAAIGVEYQYGECESTGKNTLVILASFELKVDQFL